MKKYIFIFGLLGLWGCKRLPPGAAMQAEIPKATHSITYTAPGCTLSANECNTSYSEFDGSYTQVYYNAVGGGNYEFQWSRGGAPLYVKLCLPELQKSANLKVIQDYDQQKTQYSVYVYYGSTMVPYECTNGIVNLKYLGGNQYQMVFCNLKFKSVASWSNTIYISQSLNLTLD